MGGLLLALAASAGASETAPARTPAAAKPAAAAAASADAPAAPAGAEGLEGVKRKLAERLGATTETGRSTGLRITNKAADAPPARSPARPAAAPAAAAHAATEAHHTPHWGYEGAWGPQAWGQIKPEFALCAQGRRQSPIDIRGGIAVELPPIQFDYRPTGFQVLDNGHTIQANLGSGNAITLHGRRYDLLQFHFHRPSEERVEGRQYDMVAHLVHRDPEGRLAVVAVLITRGAPNPAVQLVWNSLPLERGDSLASPVQLDLNQLLPQDPRYYTYMGSLTTPPCSEGVMWLVMKQPITLSTEQLDIFARLYPLNARPIQPAAGRLIKEGL
ncbi:carbonic anhydrase [Ideonella livida]|uniref:carbonic anhydrase n=1 Tax=Ideonella livida TaxID=2707176 RepID=UPI00287321B0|nr:carbonic anhydrase family protein [Ideonella livida]